MAAAWSPAASSLQRERLLPGGTAFSGLDELQRSSLSSRGSAGSLEGRAQRQRPALNLGLASSSVPSGAALGLALYAWGRRRRRVLVYRAAAPPSILRGIVGKRELKKIITWTLNNKGKDATVRLLENLKGLGFSWATKAGISLGIEDLCVPETKPAICDGARQRTLDAEQRYANGDITVVEKFLTVTGEWSKASEEVKDAALDNFKTNMPTNPVFMMATSGARGNVSQVRQLVAMRGLMADAKGELIEVPISNCFREGLSVTDVLISSHGARKGVIDTAMRTADSGYLYRRLDFAASHVTVKAAECGSDRYVEHGLETPFEPSPPLADRIRGCVLAGDVNDPETGKLMFPKGHLLNSDHADDIDKRWNECKKAGTKSAFIRVRSPLTCILKDGICSNCYGEDLSKPGQVVAVGTPVGTIAAQSMGEPGTQLTMRTFHTGGAFEGGAGVGVFAAHAGTVRLTSTTGKNIHVNMDSMVGRWLRTLQGDVACLLDQDAKLEILDNGEVIQSEHLRMDTLVRVQDGQVVTRGQNLFENDARAMVESMVSGDIDNVKIIPKPINCDQSGEIVCTDAATQDTCLSKGSQRVWVLQGKTTSFDNKMGSSLAVQVGDTLSPGVPLATEWARTSSAGVHRFTPPPLKEGVRGRGWRKLDWAGRLLEPEEEEEGTSAANSARETQVCLRTDFDWFFFSGAVSQYKVQCELPRALHPSGSTLKAFSAGVVDRYRKLDEVQDAVRAKQAVQPTTVPVHAFTPTDGPATGISVVCTTGQGIAGVMKPVVRTVKPKHVVPIGGLIFHVGENQLLWCPEESHTLELPNRRAQAVLREHGHKYEEQLDEYFTSTVPGCIGVYSPGKQIPRHIGSPSHVEIEEQGVIRRESRDRLFRKIAEGADDVSTVECVVKPGSVVACPSEYFDESWYHEVTDGCYFHQKAIPPGVPLVPGLPDMVAEADWRVVELMDSPSAGPVVRVCVRLAHLMDVPENPEPAHPSEARVVTSWHVPYAQGELVRSQVPIALVQEITSSLSRQPGEQHCTTALPVESDDEGHGLLASHQPQFSSEFSGLTLQLEKTLKSGDLCVVQHSALGMPQEVTGAGDWQEPAPRYVAAKKADSAAAPSARRQLISEGGGCVCRIDSGSGGQTTVVTIGEEDLMTVPCQEQPTVPVGTLLRVGDAISASDKAPAPGQILFVEIGKEGQAPFQVTMRMARAYLVTNNGEMRVREGAIVEQGDVIGMENLLMPKTTDITQGLPKVTQLFEDTGGLKQERLMEFFEEEQRHHSNYKAAKVARDRLREELVAEIQSTYLEQGVFINGRHIEIVVAEMTGKCEITKGDGLTAIPGKMISYTELEGLLTLSRSSGIRVKPAVRGVTRVGKDLHVLVSMGFREGDNIVSQAVMSGPGRYPMRGIKENLMMGKMINAGFNDTGTPWKVSEKTDLSEIPYWVED